MLEGGSLQSNYCGSLKVANNSKWHNLAMEILNFLYSVPIELTVLFQLTVLHVESTG